MMRLPLYRYRTLVDAYVRIRGGTPDLIDRLIWGSYTPGRDTTHDSIVEAAIGLLF